MTRDTTKRKGSILDFGGVDHHNRIIWILLVTIVWYVFIFSSMEVLVTGRNSIFRTIIDAVGYEVDAMKFILMYAGTLTSFVGFLVYMRVTKRNRFVFRDCMPGYKNNKFRQIIYGLIVGFAMNFGCILLALIHGDIKLFLNFSATQIPFYCIALILVFIQSSSEEMWCRGFMYERVNVHYPLWVAILVNGVFFGALHMFNPGVSPFPVIEIMICGISFSLAKWYTGSIWFPMGIHTAWNFTQNLIFGLPNSGLVSEASVLGLDAASAQDSLVYDVSFGVEGAWPALAADAILGIVCLILAARKGRLSELTQKLGTQVYEKDLPSKEEQHYVYAEDAGETGAVENVADEVDADNAADSDREL